MKIAVYCIYPNEIQHAQRHLAEDLLRHSLDLDHMYYNTPQRVYYNSWGLDNNSLLAALKTFDRHRSKAHSDLKLVICLMCHGDPGAIVWNNGKQFTAVEILEALQQNEPGSINLVCFFSCLTFQNFQIPRHLPFSVLGYITKTFVDQSPYFLSRLLNEYCRSTDLNKAVQNALKYSDLQRKQIKFRV